MENQPDLAGSGATRGIALQLLLKFLLVAIIVVIIALLIIIPARQQADRHSDQAQSSPELSGVLGGGERNFTDEGYAKADLPRNFDFPRDHGPHPEYRNEWWYFTGNLSTPEGRRFGYQWVIFRIALQSENVERESDWATNQVYMAHFAITDPAGEAFHYSERFSRGGAGLAGAESNPPRIWLENWNLDGDDTGSSWRLRAAQDQASIDIEMEAVKPVVLNGRQGLSQKSAEPGNASYYYSIPRLDTRGIVGLGNEQFQVRGSSWFDREWSTSALAQDQTGWDWFALQLDDGSDLMYYQLRRSDGSVDPFSSGTLTDPAGNATTLASDDVAIEVLDTWQSPSGTRYPARWWLRMPERNISLEIVPILSNQELAATIPYWEGAVNINGSRDERTISGYGYVELVGY